MVTNESKYRKSKHILTKIKYVKEQYEEGVINIIKMDTNDLCADMLTKPLTGKAYKKHSMKFMMD